MPWLICRPSTVTAISSTTSIEASGRTVTVSSKLVSKNDNIVPSLKALFDSGTGAQMFAVPLDAYYGLRNYEPAKDLGDFGVENQLPVVSFAMVRVPGALLYIGADFASVGGLSGLCGADTARCALVIGHGFRVGRLRDLLEGSP